MNGLGTGSADSVPYELRCCKPIEQQHTEIWVLRYFLEDELTINAFEMFSSQACFPSTNRRRILPNDKFRYLYGT